MNSAWENKYSIVTKQENVREIENDQGNQGSQESFQIFWKIKILGFKKFNVSTSYLYAILYANLIVKQQH